MTVIHIVLKDTEDGLVDVETTIEGFDLTSNAQALAGRINGFLAEVAEHKDAPSVIVDEAGAALQH